jgi:ATP-dependent exoDNAse (exonuclease V) alpha subunit
LSYSDQSSHLISPSRAIQKKFQFEPTAGQLKLFSMLDDFILNESISKQTLLIKGYAGTGKTSVVTSLVSILKYYNYKSLLMAPTGRAAKVMAQYAGRKAFTIHKIIYKLKSEEGAPLLFQKQSNYFKRTIFIVDEVSMVSDQADYGNQSLMEDLIRFVFEVPGNKLILIGDYAQLPPVGQSESPALQLDKLTGTFNLNVSSIEFTEVMRQELNSGILRNATSLRNQIAKREYTLQLNTRGYKDIYRVETSRMEDGLRYAYDKFGIENTIIICRSNRMAVQYNQFIRRTIHFYENEVEVGDYLMVVRNNYAILPEESAAGFLANGDFVEVMKVGSEEEMHGFRFLEVTLRLIDYPQEPHFQCKILLDTLYSFNTSLTQDQNKQLYQNVLADYMDITSKKKRTLALKSDPYLNALQVKFAYALTCHKSQGGQWDAVFLDQGYLKEENLGVDYLRWLYTAVTRATKELYLLNFNDKFFIS